MKRFLSGIGSLLAIIVLVVGIPIALILLVGNPIPSLEELQRALTTPDYGGLFLVGTLLPIIAWIAWATFAIGFFIELPAQLRHVPAPRIPGLGLQQRSAAVLIAAVVVMFSSLASLAPASANAVELPTASISQSAHLATGVAQAHVDQVEEPAVEVAPAAASYTVQDGDSLWKIAEQTLGSGERWGEIAQLNYGVVQGDGWALDGQHWLNAGWTLTLPADAATTAVDAAAETVIVETPRTVVEGDTLWDIAEQELGDGARYPEIFNASLDQVQPGGRTITDPNLIYPGEVVDIPHETIVTAPAAVTSTPLEVPVEETAPVDVAAEEAPAAAEVPVEGAAAGIVDVAAETAAETPTDLSGLGIAPTATSATGESTTVSVPTAAVDENESDWIDELFNIRTAGGIGAIAAAGLLTLLGLRRQRQRRNRKPGQRISMPTGEASTMELELRAVENPLGMDDVDHTLRYLALWAQDNHATLPQLYALRLTETEIALYLDEPATLPAPFEPVTDDHQAWTITPSLIPELERIPSAPYPALVTIGQDQGNAHVMVDLEHIGSLNLTGNKSSVDGALTALAVELATSKWADDLQITLVGVAPGLPRALDTGRVRHVNDIQGLLVNLRGQAEATKRALAELGVDSIEEARSLDRDAEAWIPEIALLAELPDESTQAELAELVTHLPRVGIASISAGQLAGDWTLNLPNDQSAQLQIPAAGATLQLTPQIVNQEELSRILELFGVTDITAPTVDGSWPLATVVDEIPLEQIPAPSSTDISIDEILTAEAPRTETALEEPATEIPQAVTEIVEETFPGNPIVQLHSQPYIQVLGTVGLFGARGDEPRTPQTSEVNRSVVARATELIAFLALHPGANAVEVHDALWPGKDASGKQAQQSRNGLTTKARKWLGNAPDGAPHLPPVGTAGYRLEQVRSDWDLWLELVGPNVKSTSTQSLVDALKLVKGQPFAGVKQKYYVWAERLRQEMIAAIGDAAHELATRSLKSGDTTSARLAAAVGRQIDPINEIYWRDAMRAEHQAGDLAGFDRVVTQLEDHLSSFEDGYEAEPETQELIESIRDRHAIAS